MSEKLRVCIICFAVFRENFTTGKTTCSRRYDGCLSLSRSGRIITHCIWCKKKKPKTVNKRALYCSKACGDAHRQHIHTITFCRAIQWGGR